MINIFKRKKLIKFDPENPDFSVFTQWLDDSSFKKKAQKCDGCRIASIDKNYSVMITTGNGWDSFKCCIESLKSLFKYLIKEYEKNGSKFDIRPLIDSDYWICEIYIKTWK